MRSLSLRLGLLLVLISAGAGFAEEQQDDKSYLPPASLRAVPKPASAAQTQRAAAEPATRKHAKVHRRHYRERAWPRYAFWGMF